MHLKRQRVPNSWPVYRKGTKYIVRPGFSKENGIPLLIAVRDILNIAQNRKEVKRSIFLKQILVNNKQVRSEKNSLILFDVLSLVPLKKHYRVGVSEKGKFEFKEIKEEEANKKISKIIDKKTVKGKKTQLNLNGGGNVLSDIKCSVNDSVLINLKDKKIEKCLPLKENSNVLVFAGKHAGKKGKIKKIDTEKKTLELEAGKEGINVLFKQAIIIE